MDRDSLTDLKIFPWDVNFDTGIDLIDEQHKKLVDILNELALHLANRSKPKALQDIFDQLSDYANYHFKCEEEIWNKHLQGDDWLTSHEATHDSFLKSVTELQNNAEGRPLEDVINDAVSFLTHWLAYHILDTDKRMAKVVLGIEQGLSMEQSKAGADEAMAGSMQVIINTILTMYSSLSDRTLTLMRERALRLEAEKALRYSEERWQFILQTDIEGIWEWDMEKDIANFSADDIGLLNISGKVPEHPVQNPKIHPDDIERVQQDYEDHVSGKTPFFSNKHRVLHSEGNWSWVLTRGKIISRDEHNKPLRMIGTHADITRRELATMIYDNTNEAIFITDSNNKIINANQAFTHITGYSLSDVIGRSPSLLSSSKHDEPFYQNMWESLLKEGCWNGEIWNKHANGTTYPAAISISVIRDHQGNIDHHFAVFSDITEKKQTEEMLFDQAYKDILTGLPNRRMCLQRLEQSMLTSKRSKLAFAVLYIDLDHFKEVNDSFGHTKGDQLLIEVASRIKSRIRDTDTLCRLGGDEFTVIINEIHEAQVVERVAQNIIDAIKKPFLLDTDKAYVSCSIGITLYPEDASDITTLLKNADQAMYMAKKTGRDGFRYFTPAMQHDLEYRQGIKNELHTALINNEFEVYYQPLVNFSTGTIEKAEALLRWFHPVRGAISPEEFIPIAEESGLIIEIGTWVYRQVFAQLASWQQAGLQNIRICVNNSPAQFRSDKRPTKLIKELLVEYQLPGEKLIVEITEGLLMHSEQHVHEQLLELRNMGIEVALDDFGTGYSSLSYLKQFDIDYIKIDQSFVQNLKRGSQDAALCEAMTAMAHKLDIMVVTEGVENEEQRDILSGMGCDFAQGFLYHHPMSAKEMTKVLISASASG